MYSTARYGLFGIKVPARAAAPQEGTGIPSLPEPRSPERESIPRALESASPFPLFIRAHTRQFAVKNSTKPRVPFV